MFRLYLIARLPKSPRLTPFSSHAEYHRERSVWAAFTLTYFYMTFCLKPLKPNFDWTYYSKRKEKICTAQENNVLASLWKAAIIFIYLFIHSFIHSFIYDTAAVISYCSRQAPVQANYARDSQAPSTQGGSSIQDKEAARVFHYLFPEVVSLGSYLDLNSFTYLTGFSYCSTFYGLYALFTGFRTYFFMLIVGNHCHLLGVSLYLAGLELITAFHSYS